MFVTLIFRVTFTLIHRSGSFSFLTIMSSSPCSLLWVDSFRLLAMSVYCVLCTADNSYFAHVVNYNAVDLNNNDRCVCTVYRARIATRRDTTVRQQFSHEKYLFGIAKPTLIVSMWILVELPSRLCIFESLSPTKYGKISVFSAHRSDPRPALMTASAEKTKRFFFFIHFSIFYNVFPTAYFPHSFVQGGVQMAYV